MEADDLKHLALRLAALAERLDQRSEAAGQRIDQAAGAMERGAQQLAAGTANFTRDVSQALRQQAGEIIGSGLAKPMEHFDQQLRSAAQAATAAAQGLERERHALHRERRSWLWLGGGALLIGSLLAVGASVYAVRNARAQVERQQVEANLLRALNQADVTLCGDVLCANTDEAAQRHGDRKQYRPIKPRSAP